LYGSRTPTERAGKKKNLRMIGDTPLVGYVLRTLSEIEVFDKIYLNSESSILGEIAVEYGGTCYRRPDKLATDKSTNDEFGLEFMNNVDGDVLIQVLPTSPFLLKEEANGLPDMVRLRYTKLEGNEALYNCWKRKNGLKPSSPLAWIPFKDPFDLF